MTNNVTSTIEATALAGHDEHQRPVGPEAGLTVHKGAARELARGRRAADEATARAMEARARVAAALAQRAGEADLKAARIRSRDQRKATRREARAARRARLARRLRWATAYVRMEAASVYALTVYVVVVAVAGSSQAEAAHDEFGWAWPKAIGGAVFLEGMTLAFALTAQWLRLGDPEGRYGPARRGERALVPRALTWAMAGFAAWINYRTHSTIQLEALILGATSIGGIAVYEVRANARARQALRRSGQLDQPRPRLGVAFCVRYPRPAFWTWSAMVALPSLTTLGQAKRAGRLMRAMRARRRLDAKATKAAGVTLRRAARKGQAEPALTQLRAVAHYGLTALAPPAAEPGPTRPAGLGPALGAGPDSEAALKADHPRPGGDEAGPARPSPRLTVPKATIRFPRTGGPAGRNRAVPVEGRGAGARPDWSRRPGGPVEWEARLAELAAYFPPGGDLLPYRKVMQVMRQRAEQGHRLGHVWTSNQHVGWAVADLKALRAAGLPEPADRTGA